MIYYQKRWGSGLEGKTKRCLIQLCAALAYNLNLEGFTEVSIYKGKRKSLYVLGLNCYSCPGVIGSCPLGTLQNSPAAMNRKLPFYIPGTLLLFGAALGKTICGFPCLFRFLQELLYRIPLPKIKKSRFTMALSKVKYAVLAVFVIVLPIALKAAVKAPVPAFCKYTCPAGILEDGILLTLLGESLGNPTGALLSWEVLVLAMILLSACFLYKGFCRSLCPLGAVYSLSAPVALLGVKIDHDVCTDCKLYVRTCKMDARYVGDMECTRCGECMKECGVDTVHWKKPFGRQRRLRNIVLNEHARPKAFLSKSNTHYKDRVLKILCSVIG